MENYIRFGFTYFCLSVLGGFGFLIFFLLNVNKLFSHLKNKK